MSPEVADARTVVETARKTVVIVAPHFPPSNLAGVHRPRLLARHLRAFGFEPIVVSIEPRFYEEPLDPELLHLLPDSVRVVRTRALPTRPLRIVGDISLRAFWHLYRSISRLAQRGRVDLLLVTIPPNYASLLGPLIKRRFGIPYVIDYQDPWVYPMTEAEQGSPKARATHWLARRLEPLALRHVDGLTSVAPAYLDGVFARHPRLRALPWVTMPIGGEPADHEFVERTQRRSAVLSLPGLQGKRVVVYAGAVLPRARQTVETLFRACALLRSRRPELADAARFVFVGTGARASDPSSGQVLPIAARNGVADLVVEVANRQPYLEVLAVLHRAHGIMILGSSEPHYTPSKVFQALHARRPILAILHQASTAVDLLRGIAGVELVAFSEDHPVTDCVHEITKALARMLEGETGEPLERSAEMLDRYSARAVTAQLAACLDAVLAARHGYQDHRQA